MVFWKKTFFPRKIEKVMLSGNNPINNINDSHYTLINYHYSM